MVKKIIVIGFIFIQSVCYAQYKNSVWCFGDSARIDFVGGVATAGGSAVNSRGSCASIADSANNVLFYCSDDSKCVTVIGYGWGGDVYNKMDTIMENGDSLHGVAWYNEQLIIPYPATPNQFFIFSLDLIGYAGAPIQPGLYYSIVDLNFNGGLGKVTTKNNQLIDTTMSDVSTAIRHGNGRDWWYLCMPMHYPGTSDTIYEYLITPNGISPPTKIKVGTATLGGAGTLTFSHNGQKLLFTHYAGLIELYNFDRCTGAITLDNTIQSPPPVISAYAGSCFSPNDSLIYISNFNTQSIGKVRQYDLFAPNVAASEVIVGSITPSTPSNQRISGQIRSAPDGKVYLTCTWSDAAGNEYYPYPDTVYYMDNMYLATIDNPNVYGLGCNFNAYGFYLGGKRTYWGLPNNPDYEMGAWVGSVCDTLTGNLTLTQPMRESMLNVYPNPVEHNLWVGYTVPAIKNVEIVILDVLGNEIIRRQLPPNSSEVVLDVKKLSNGVYFIQVVTDKEKLNGKFVKQ